MLRDETRWGKRRETSHRGRVSLNFFSWTARRSPSSREVTRNSCCSLSLSPRPSRGVGLAVHARRVRGFLPQLGQGGLMLPIVVPGRPASSQRRHGVSLPARPLPASLLPPPVEGSPSNGSPPQKIRTFPVRYFQLWGNRKNASESFGLLKRIGERWPRRRRRSRGAGSGTRTRDFVHPKTFGKF